MAEEKVLIIRAKQPVPFGGKVRQAGWRVGVKDLKVIPAEQAGAFEWSDGSENWKPIPVKKETKKAEAPDKS